MDINDIFEKWLKTLEYIPVFSSKTAQVQIIIERVKWTSATQPLKFVIYADSEAEKAFLTQIAEDFSRIYAKEYGYQFDA